MANGKHHPKRYATVRKLNGVRTVVFGASCGPCRMYGRLFMSAEGRDRALAPHEGGDDAGHA